MALYKPGDTVAIRDDLRTGIYYQMNPPDGKGWVAIGSMIRMRGKYVTIKDHIEDGPDGLCGGAYRIKELDNVVWTDEMFSGLAYADSDDVEMSEDDVSWLLM